MILFFTTSRTHSFTYLCCSAWMMYLPLSKQHHPSSARRIVTSVAAKGLCHFVGSMYSAHYQHIVIDGTISILIEVRNCIASTKKNLVSTRWFRQITDLYPTCHFYLRSGSRVHKQMTGYLQQNNLLPEFKSAYRYHDSSESAVLKVFSNIVDALDRGNLVLLSLLDMSTAFDTVDHDILRQRLTMSFGIWAKSLQWLDSGMSQVWVRYDSYLTGRIQPVYLAGMSTTSQNRCLGRCCSCSTRPTSAASFEFTISYTTAMRTTCNYTSPVHRRKVRVLSLESLCASRT